MIRNTIVSAAFGAAVFIATSMGANAMPSKGQIQEALQAGAAQADII